MTRRGIFIALATLVVSALWPVRTADACPVCFRLDDAGTVSGVYAAVFVLLAVTTGVLGGFAVFVARLVRRARRGEDDGRVVGS